MWNLTWKSLTVLIPSMVVSFLFIMVSYNSPFTYTFNFLLRYPPLKVIDLGVKVYDPVNIIKPNLGNIGKQNEFHNYGKTKKDLKRYLSSSNFPSPRISKFKNHKIVHSQFPFGYQPYIEERASQFRNLYGTKLQLNVNNDFMTLQAISNFVKGLWKHGESRFNPQSFDAIEIIQKAKKGNRYWCHVYSLTFIQIASSLGLTARLVSLSDDGYENDHAVVEAWSNYYHKWVILDIDYNLFYTWRNDDIPLNAVELHNAFLENDLSEIFVQKGTLRPFGFDVERDDTKLLRYYRYIDIDLRNDWYINRYFRGHPNRSDMNTMFWEDHRLPSILSLYNKTANLDDFYWTLNETEIYFKGGNGTGLELSFNTFTPNFEMWIISLDDNQPKTLNSNSFSWNLHQGTNSISVASRNKYGVSGIESRIEIQVDKL